MLANQYHATHTRLANSRFFLLEISPHVDINNRRTGKQDNKAAKHLQVTSMETQNSNFRLTPLKALEQAAECLKVLAHPHRLRMVQMLLGGRYTVGELAEACEIPSHMASEHLRLMQRCGFLHNEKEGRKAYYQIAEPHLAEIMKCVEARFDSA
jgi:ArsR family transcriptional regulator, zinc-responsive transcriptional repressor